MTTSLLQDRLSAFDHWKKRQLRTIDQLKPWLKQQDLYTKEVQNAIRTTLDNLSSEDLTIAIVGEFSRGKTELINALFFNDYGKRLLPTDAGRTTMCPTEIFQDSKKHPCLQLLPIETRLQDKSLIELQADKSQWIEFPLNLDNADEIEKNLQRITESLYVKPKEAEKLGLAINPELQSSEKNNLVQIPKWRMAAINMRHPLLAQGIKILDTPGLNAIGNEPELTYEILPNAQAKLFVLGADTGVTRSDLDIWQTFANKDNQKNQHGMMVILNKVDTLWDELRNESEIEASINKQCNEVARILNIDVNQVYATSAQKALVASIKNDDELKAKTKITDIENHLAKSMVNNRQNLIVEQSGQQMDNALLNIEHTLINRLDRSIKQTKDLSDLSDKSDSVLDELLTKAKTDKAKYQNSILTYKESKNTFKRYGLSLQKSLDPESLNTIIDASYKKMTSSWTTLGLKDAIKSLFDEINKRMDESSENTRTMRRLIRAIYRRFQTDHNFQLPPPLMFSIVDYQVKLGLLHQQSEIYRNSTRTLLTEQHFAIKRYFETIIRKTQTLFEDADIKSGNWLETAMEPLAIQVKEHKQALSTQLEDLKSAAKSRKTVHVRIKTLTQETRVLEGQIGSLKNVRQALSNATLPQADGQMKPQLVKKIA